MPKHVIKKYPNSDNNQYAVPAELNKAHTNAKDANSCITIKNHSLGYHNDLIFLYMLFPNLIVVFIGDFLVFEIIR